MDFEFPRGDTKLFKFQLKDKNGEIINLSTGDKLYFTVKKTTKSTTVVFQKTLSNGIVKDGDYYKVTIQSDDTAQLGYGDYAYDIELKSAEGVVKTLTLGTITLTDEVTWKGDES